MIRLIGYAIIALLYHLFMSSHAPLGVDWRPFHFERVLNASENYLSQPSLARFGLTAWDDWSLKYNMLPLGEHINAYTILAAKHIHHIIVYKLFGKESLLVVGQLFDFLCISIVGILAAELFPIIGKRLPKIFTNILPLLIFLIFLTSTWSYRMILAPWTVVSWSLFYLAAVHLDYRKKHIASSLSLFLAALTQYQLSIMLLAFFLVKRFRLRFSKHNSKTALFAFGCHIDSLIAVLTGVVIQALTSFLAYNFSDPAIVHSGSKLLYRIGIDGPSNIHHGGLLASFQYLLGHRLSVCIEPSKLLNVQSLPIYQFNCSLTLIGNLLLSIIGVIGIVMLLKSSSFSVNYLMPVFFIFLSMNLIFQQSYAVHLQGYSFLFAIGWALGTVDICRKVLTKLSSDKLTVLSALSVISLAITIHSIRSSYLTGING
jgi:hypothetical protein